MRTHPLGLIWILLITALWATTLTGCATPRSEPSSQASSSDTLRIDETAARQSSVDITYTLGHSQHQLRLDSQGEKVLIRSYSEHALVEEGTSTVSRYLPFLKEVADFAQRSQGAARAAADSAGCKTPFALRLKVGSETRHVIGCRTHEDPRFSRLVKDGEFLLVSSQRAPG